MSRPFQTLTHPTEFCYEEKRSRFHAYVWPVKSKEEGFEFFNAMKQQHPDARHHCWAYLIGDPEQALMAGFNDDGEPGGTAGKPMLNVLTQRKVGNSFAAVARYFGGIKLGAGGLTRAYGQAVSGALDLAEFCMVVPTQPIEIIVSFALEQRVRNLLSQMRLSVSNTVYDAEKVLLQSECPQDQIGNLQNQLREQTSGSAILKTEK
ncbi:YigZ family protein [Saccharophagus sp. K07]|jgi:uncharacterized YigZ family protein|uniref:IMPACT family protein n=1 Tax=Saccharophagus sp. K07 TaxID=2283636 RepID=UPI0016529FD5|nr:YigZ family protein [Saccharophagus sp. K07]MBC6904306.1 YigZ family protein [Saccharophagus sp. K07]